MHAPIISHMTDKMTMCIVSIQSEVGVFNKVVIDLTMLLSSWSIPQ